MTELGSTLSKIVCHDRSLPTIFRVIYDGPSRRFRNRPHIFQRTRILQTEARSIYSLRSPRPNR